MNRLRMLVVSFVLTLLVASNVLAFDAPISRINPIAEVDTTPIENVRLVCADYCEDGVRYYDGAKNALTGRCFYATQTCTHGCDGDMCKESDPLPSLIKDVRSDELVRDFESDRFIDPNTVRADTLEIGDIPHTLKRKLIFIADTDIIVIDANTFTQIARFEVERTARQIAISPDDAVLYAIGSIREINAHGEFERTFLTRINATSGEEIGQTDLGISVLVYGFEVAPDGRVYIGWKTRTGLRSGYLIFDFEKNLVWKEDYYDKVYTAQEFVFDNDGSTMYASITGPEFLVIDWDENTRYRLRRDLYKYFSRIWWLAANDDAQMIYFAGPYWDRIAYLRTSDMNMQRWVEDYEVLELAFSKSAKALYALGFKDGETLISKMTGLKGISAAYPAQIEDFVVSDPASFYMSSTRRTLDIPDDEVGWRMELSPDERHLIIVANEYRMGGYYRELHSGGRILVYDAHSLEEIGRIETDPEYGSASFAFTKTPISWEPVREPSPDSLRTDFVIIPSNAPKIEVLSPYVTSLDPHNGSFNAPIDAPIIIRFSDDIDPGSVDDQSIIVLSSHYAPIEGERTVDHTTVRFTPNEPYAQNSKIFVTVTDRVKSVRARPAFWGHYAFTTGEHETGAMFEMPITTDVSERISSRERFAEPRTLTDGTDPLIPFEAVEELRSSSDASETPAQEEVSSSEPEDDADTVPFFERIRRFFSMFWRN
jgi:hypothetical protein